MSAFFVTGTGTDIGKTYAACGLIRGLRAAGCAVDALKPLASGFDASAAEGSDPAELLLALGRSVDEAGLDAIAPVRFAAPLAPNMAARAEGRTVDYVALKKLCHDRMRSSPGLLLIEGAGGVMSPADDGHTMLDLIADLEAPAILVAGCYLGAISHALTAIAALTARRRPIRALIVNESQASAIGLAETAGELERFARLPTYGIAHGQAPERALADLIAQMAREAGARR